MVGAKQHQGSRCQRGPRRGCREVMVKKLWVTTDTSSCVRLRLRWGAALRAEISGGKDGL